MALWDEVLGPLGTLWTHFWAPGAPGKLLGVSETGILEEFHFWLRKALKWTNVNESMKCYTISESSWHVLFRFIRFKLDFLHFMGARSLRRTKIRKSTTSTRSWISQKTSFFLDFFLSRMKRYDQMVAYIPNTTRNAPHLGLKTHHFQEFLVLCSNLLVSHFLSLKSYIKSVPWLIFCTNILNLMIFWWF